MNKFKSLKNSKTILLLLFKWQKSGIYRVKIGLLKGKFHLGIILFLCLNFKLQKFIDIFMANYLICTFWNFTFIQNIFFMKTITINDETAVGKILNQISLEVEKEIMTVRDFIQARVYAEVKNYNEKLPEYFSGLIQPTDAERVLNGFKIRDRRQIDAEKQYFTALDAFQKNTFFLLVDNRQPDSLDEEILVTNDTIISFIKLIPLVGG